MATSKRQKLMEKRAKALKESNGGGGFPYFIFKEGTHRMRMPQVEEDQEICHEVMQFYLGKDIGGVISPQSFGEPCPIYELYEKLKSSSDDDDKAMLEKIKPRRRYMGPFYRYEDEKGKSVDTQSGVKLALLTGGQYQDITDLFLDDEQGDFTDPDEGYDIKFKRSGKGQFDTEYTVTPCKPTRIAKAFSKEIYDPEQMVRDIIPTYEECQEKLDKFLGVSMDDEDEEEERKPVKKKKKSATGTKKKKKRRSSDL